MLLFAFMSLDWYRYEPGGNLIGYLNLFVNSGDAWDTLDVIPFILALTVVVATCSLFPTLWAPLWSPAIHGGAVTALGTISSLLIAYRILVPPALENITGNPGHTTPKTGIFPALAAALGIAVGGCWAILENRPVRAGQSIRLHGSDSEPA